MEVDSRFDHGYQGLVSEARIRELESQLLAANTRIEELTRANSLLTSTVSTTGLALKRSRRNARQDGNTLRDQITHLQNRRS